MRWMVTCERVLTCAVSFWEIACYFIQSGSPSLPRGKFTALSAYIREEEDSHINHGDSPLEKDEHINPKQTKGRKFQR